MSETAKMSQTAVAERRVPEFNGGRLTNAGKGRPPGANRGTVLMRNALVECLRDPRGGSGKEFLMRFKTSHSAEDRRALLNVFAKLVPIEVAGDIGEMLTVKVMTLVAGPNGLPVPTEGTCLIGKNATDAPLAAPTAPEMTDEEAT